ncbi:MAG: hypothetical protein V4498_01555 [candidate division FCPU426 bacterium]
MSDRFDVQRQLDSASEEIEISARDRMAEERERERARLRRLVPLSEGYYFDPLDQAILKKTGSSFGFVRHNRRKTRRITQSQAEEAQFRLVSGGLFWDEKAKKLYRRSGAHYVLYTSDRRKKSGSVPAIGERRKRKKSG